MKIKHTLLLFHAAAAENLSLVLICRALASILAPMSPMAFPLMSNLVREVLLPRALSTMERSAFSLESASDRELSGCRAKFRNQDEKQNDASH